MSRTNELTKMIVLFLNAKGHLAFRNNTIGVYSLKSQSFRRQPSWVNTLGSGDIICCLQGGLYLEIEIKTGSDKQNENQKLRERRLKTINGKYWLIKSFEQFKTEYNLITKDRAVGCNC